MLYPDTNLRANDDKIAANLVNSWTSSKFNDTYDFEHKLDFSVSPEPSYRRTYSPSANYTPVYTYGYVYGNDSSDLLYLSNGAAIDKALEPYREKTVTAPSGQTEPAAVYDTANTEQDGLAEGFLMILDLARDLEQYPVLDEDDLSRREMENEQEYLEDLARQLTNNVDEFLESEYATLTYTAAMLWNVIRDYDLDFGYGYYGECFMRDEDLYRAAQIASWDTYRDLPCSD